MASFEELQSSLAEKDALIAELRLELLERERRIMELEDECDALAVDTGRMREDIQKLLASGGSMAVLSNDEQDAAAAVDWGSLLKDGDGAFARSVVHRYDSVCDGTNALCVAFVTYGGKAAFACGGAVGVINVYNLSSHDRLLSVRASGPVLSLDFNERLGVLAAGVMDGKLLLLDLGATRGEGAEQSTQQLCDHNKFVVAVKWGGDGLLLATASYDKTVVLYRVQKITATAAATTAPAGGHSWELAKVATLRYPNSPESVAFLPGAEGVELVVAVRESCSLVYVSCGSLEEREVSLNAHSWDKHVSFTALHLCPSPDGRYLVVATDKNMHVMLLAGTSTRVRIFAGHSCGDYGKPRLSFDPTGRYLYSNSENESCVYVYSVASERPAEVLQGHQGVVRDVCCHPLRRELLTASHDKSAIFWTGRSTL